MYYMYFNNLEKLQKKIVMAVPLREGVKKT